MLDILNQALTAGHIPQEWQQALVVEIYKGKGCTADPNNYRPISLLSTAYKLMVRILQQRLEKAIDDRLRDTQFGFRAGRSTSQPVHVLPRLLEKAERTDDSLYVLLLDWRQASDKVNIEALEVAMQRMGVPQSMVSFISHIYSSQLFQVKAAGHTSDILEAASGIRQGCPLSPYLFLIVRSMIFYDVDHQLTEEGGMMPWVFSQQRHFYDLAYADDAALVARTAERAQQLLGVVESTAAHSNLTLNWDKCLLLKSHASRNHVYNAEGGMVKETAHAKYFGVILSSSGTARKDVNERLAKARKHFSTLHHFWRHSGLPAHWKLRIYNAVFIPMLTYGLESASLSQHDLHRLEAFHSKALRKMHRIPATFYTKILEPTQPTTTNQQLREQTSQPPLTHHIHRAQLKLFGHILRAQDKCLERDCCFSPRLLFIGLVRQEMA